MSLTDLPEYVVAIISTMLEAKDICNLILCRQLKQTIEKDLIWKEKYSQEWTGFPPPKIDENWNWKTIYSKNLKWNLDKLKNFVQLSIHNAGVTSLTCFYRNQFAQSGGYLISGSHDLSINITQIENFGNANYPSYIQKGVLFGHSGTIWALKTHKDKLFSGSKDNTIKVWDLNDINYECKATLTEHKSKIFSLESHLESDLLFSGGGSIVKIWDTNTLSPVADLVGHQGGINCMQLIENSNSLLTGSSDSSFILWDVKTQQDILQVSANEKNSKVLCLAQYQNLVFTGTSDCKINVWDIHNGIKIHQIKNSHRWDVWQMCLAGGYLVSGAFDHKIKFWDLKNFSLLHTLDAHRGYIHALAATNSHLFSGSADATLKIHSI